MSYLVYPHYSGPKYKNTVLVYFTTNDTQAIPLEKNSEYFSWGFYGHFQVGVMSGLMTIFKLEKGYIFMGNVLCGSCVAGTCAEIVNLAVES